MPEIAWMPHRVGAGSMDRGNSALALLKFYGRDRPLPTVALNGDSQTVKLVKAHFFHGPGLSISEDYSLADDFRLGLLERTEND